LESGAVALNTGRYSIMASYVVCFYDWAISLDDEFAYVNMHRCLQVLGSC